MGTACHVRKAPKIVDEISRRLGIQAGETTPGLKFTLQTVNCLGACAKVCPQEAITGAKKKSHSINVEKCGKCGIYLETCRQGAVAAA